MPDRPNYEELADLLEQRHRDLTEAWGPDYNDVDMNSPKEQIIVDWDRNRIGLGDADADAPLASRVPPGWEGVGMESPTIPAPRYSRHPITPETRQVTGALYMRARRAQKRTTDALNQYEGEMANRYRVGRRNILDARAILESHGGYTGTQLLPEVSFEYFLNSPYVPERERPYLKRMAELVRRRQLASEAANADIYHAAAQHIGRLRETRADVTAPASAVGHATSRLSRLSRLGGRALGVAATVGSVDTINRAIFGSGEAFE